ncbi:MULTISPECIES: nuclear transport factor 2 family protein [unclassified Nocardia]|uniref:nuclear transport factor 2 family protein n=1 Tax=unclassified Nocardia TaxID=2637762 RepID=UPI0024A98F62|nr:MULTISPECIES: nuclear transport factor 2 family protein [unclassified Nocardia]
MNQHTSPALDLARAYFDAWTGHDMDKAMTYIAADIVCDTPAGRIRGADAFRAFLEPFADTVTSVRPLAAFGDETTALIMYDTASVPVPSAPGAELIRVENGRITQSRFIFDRLPFYLAETAATPG